MSEKPDDPELGFLFPETEEELMHFDIHQNGKGGLPPSDIDAIAARVLTRLGSSPGVAVQLSCTYCKGGLARGGSVYCAGCLAPHHPDCFHEYSGCSSCGEARFVLPKNLGAPRKSPSRSRPWAFLGGLTIGGLAVALGFTQWSSFSATAPQPTPRVEAPVEPGEAPHDHDQPEPPREDFTENRLRAVDLEELLAKARDSSRAGRYAEALAAYTRLIELDPSAADCYAERAQVLISLKQYARAMADLEKALSLAPNQPRLALLAARVSLSRGDMEAALRYAESSLSLDPASPEGYVQRAAIYTILTRHHDSARDLRRAIELEPMNPEYCRRLARSLMALGRLQEARAYLERAIAIEPRDAASYALRAELLKSLGQLQAAAADLDRARELDPRQARETPRPKEEKVGGNER